MFEQPPLLNNHFLSLQKMQSWYNVSKHEHSLIEQFHLRSFILIMFVFHVVEHASLNTMFTIPFKRSQDDIGGLSSLSEHHIKLH